MDERPREATTNEGGTDRKLSFIEQARRRQILDAAIEVLAQHGLAGATFARIADRAEISPALISYHFANKTQLMRQVVATITEAMDAAITAEIGDAQSYRSALRGLIETQVHYFAEHTNEVLALGQLYGVGAADPLATEMKAAREQTLDELEEMFRDGQAEGELRAFPTRLMAVTLLVALEAVPAELLAEPGADPAVYAVALADLFDAATRA